MSDFLSTQVEQDAALIRISGEWRIDNIRTLEHDLGSLDALDARTLRFDYSALTGMDLSGAWLLKRKQETLAGQQRQIEQQGQTPQHFGFIEDFIERAEQPAAAADGAQSHPLARALDALGRRGMRIALHARQGLAYFGQLVLTGAEGIARPKHLRIASVTRHVFEAGIQAIPIVALIAFLISIIVAYLGAQQLQQFGADIFTVDLVAIAVLREMGVLLTAILVAGRSGSAFAAEIGVMRLNDEVDALRSIGVNTFEVLVLPRVLGLLIALPLLTIVADACGLIGGGILSDLLLDIRPSQYIARVQQAISPTTFWAGILKAPVFAILIAIVGTMRGMEVRDSSRELGRLTTMAVVQAIFLVIFADAIFAIVFVQLDF
jgi:phospholipid/cholesterol/gamma-HCH transport system permease protein